MVNLLALQDCEYNTTLIDTTAKIGVTLKVLPDSGLLVEPFAFQPQLDIGSIELSSSAQCDVKRNVNSLYIAILAVCCLFILVFVSKFF